MTHQIGCEKRAEQGRSQPPAAVHQQVQANRGSKRPLARNPPRDFTL